MALTNQQIAACRDSLAEVHWQNFLTTEVPRTSDTEIQRTIGECDPDLYDAYRQFLEAYTSAKNPDESYTVTDPLVNQVPAYGVWRHAGLEIRMQGSVPFLVQTLREGYATTLNDDEARLIQHEEPDSAGKLAIIRWVNLDPQGNAKAGAQAWCATLNSRDFSTDALSIRGYSYGSGWDVSRPVISWADDGSGVVTVYLSKPDSTGAVITQSVKCSESETATFKWNLSKSQLDTFENSYSTSSSGEQRTFRILGRSSEDGTYSAVGIVTTDLQQYIPFRKTADAVAQYEQTRLYRNKATPSSMPSRTQGRQINVRLGITDTCLYDEDMVYRTSEPLQTEFGSRVTKFRGGWSVLYDNNRAKLEVPAAPDSGIYTLTQRHEIDGTYSGRLDYLYGTNEGEARFASSRAELEDSDSVIYRDRTSQVEAQDSAQGYIYQADNQLTDDGLYNASLLYRGSKEKLAEFRSNATRFRVGHTILYNNNRELPEAPEADGSGIYRLSVRENTDGTYTGQLDYLYGTGEGEARFDSRRSTLISEDAVIYRDQETQIDAHASGQGYLYNASNTLNRDGLYDASLVYRGFSQLSTGARVETTAFRTQNAILYRNWPSVIEAPASPGSGIYRVQGLSVSEVGLYDGLLVYDSGTNSGEKRYESANSTVEEEDTFLYRDRPAPVDAPTHIAGGLYRSQFSLDDRGLYSGVMVYQWGKAVRASHDSAHGTDSDTVNTLYVNQESPVDAPAEVAGTLYDSRFSINRFGLYDGSVSADTAKAWLYNVGRVAATVDGDRTRALYGNRESLPTLHAHAEGQVYRIANARKNRWGRYDYEVVADESTESTQGIHSYATKWGTAYWKMFFNVPSSDVESDIQTFANLYSNYNVSAQPSRNADGTFNVTARAQPTSVGNLTVQSWGTGETGMYFHRTIRDANGNGVKWIKFQRREKEFLSSASAEAYLSGTEDGFTEDDNRPGTRIVRKSHSQFLAIRMRYVSESDTLP